MWLGRVQDNSERVQQSFLALCHDTYLRVAIGFLGIVGSLGHNRGFLYYDGDFLALCRDRNFVSRQGLRLELGASVATRVPFMSLQSFPKVGPFLS